MKRSLKVIPASAFAVATASAVAFFALPASAEAASFSGASTLTASGQLIRSRIRTADDF
ncbi:hypothetical protein [Actinoplanes siamensis]|uniref:hypothetical protein n=1 Tax=Actinoplanes siamensis TaxID=1223317 RepID=UPI00194121A6|nr:hypothetical protein [Actinoplanes siamensis]